MERNARNQAWKTLLWFVPLFVFVFAQLEVYASERSEQNSVAVKDFGKLVVTYHTDAQSIDPEAVKFRLTGSDGMSTTHPESESDKIAKLESGQVVMIQDVTPGEYTIEYFIDFDSDYVSLLKEKVSIKPSKTQFVRSKIASFFSANVEKPATEEFTKQETSTPKVEEHATHYNKPVSNPNITNSETLTTAEVEEISTPKYQITYAEDITIATAEPSSDCNEPEADICIPEDETDTEASSEDESTIDLSTTTDIGDLIIVTAPEEVCLAEERVYTVHADRCNACGQIYCTNDCPYWNPPQPAEPVCARPTTCAPIEDPCCERVEYVSYKPWEDGADAGLYCLPGSKCTYSCPTCPSGDQIYRHKSKLAHKSRYPSEYSPEEWHTIMMHMRVILPMTACDYRKVLSFMQEEPYEPEKKICLSQNTNLSTTSTNNQENIATNETSKSTDTSEKELLAQNDALEEDLSLDEMIGPISTEGIDFLDAPVPSGSFGMPSKLNHVFTGYLILDYSSPTSSFFGDFNGNNSFSYLFVPIFLSRYGEHILMAAKLAAFNFGQEVRYTLPYAYVAYLYNDYLTLQFGKFTIPFGNYFNHFVGWIDKSATPPLARTFFEDFAIAPNVEIGAEVKGAIPLCNLGNCFRNASFTYDFWVGNGPSEVNASTNPEDRYPIGSIYYNTGEANSPNNNNCFTWGGRLGFLPNDCNIFGISYMKGRWDSNKRSFGTDRHLYFEGAAFDLNMNWQYTSLRGEYIWTQYENGIEEFEWVRQNAYWVELAFELGILKCALPSLFYCNPCLWDSLELVLRSDAVWSQDSGRTILGYDYSGFDKRRASVTLGYYFTQTFIARIGYDINYGDTGLNTTLNNITGATRETGFAKNVFTFRIAYGW